MADWSSVGCLYGVHGFRLLSRETERKWEGEERQTDRQTDRHTCAHKDRDSSTLDQKIIPFAFAFTFAFCICVCVCVYDGEVLYPSFAFLSSECLWYKHKRANIVSLGWDRTAAMAWAWDMGMLTTHRQAVEYSKKNKQRKKCQPFKAEAQFAP